MRKLFITKGGRPIRQHPIYMILGDSPVGPHSLDAEYDFRVRIPLGAFSPDDISFTYPDSLYVVPLDDLGRLYLERNQVPTIYRMEELEEVVNTYQVYKYNNHYVEAQIWVDSPLQVFAERHHWQRCR